MDVLDVVECNMPCVCDNASMSVNPYNCDNMLLESMGVVDIPNNQLFKKKAKKFQKNLSKLFCENLTSSRKRYEFSLSLYILHVLSLVYLNLWVVNLIWDICCFGDGLDEFLLCLDFWVFLFRLLGFYFCFHGWYGLIVSIDLFDVWISYPLCYDFFLFTVMHFVCVFDWFKMVVFRRLSYLFIMCVASVFWILSTLCWLDRFILFMPYLIVICPLLVKCVLH